MLTILVRSEAATWTGTSDDESASHFTGARDATSSRKAAQRYVRLFGVQYKEVAAKAHDPGMVQHTVSHHREIVPEGDCLQVRQVSVFGARRGSRPEERFSLEFALSARPPQSRYHQRM